MLVRVRLSRLCFTHLDYVSHIRLHESYNPALWGDGEIITLRGMHNPGNEGVFKIKKKIIESNRFLLLLGEVDFNELSPSSCPNLPIMNFNTR